MPSKFCSEAFALNRALFKIFGALSKDTYQDICKYFGIWTVEEQSKFNLRYCASESAVCQTISKFIEVVVKIGPITFYT